jgi:hypothetical protein
MCIRGSRALAASMVLLAAAGCGRTKTSAGLAPLESLDAALLPRAFAANLLRAGGGHFHATATFHVDVATQAEPGDGSKPKAPAKVTTTTDLWMDKAGNFRLSESNDQDGGRDIVRAGGEVAVALRYGKLVRRPAQDAESNRLLAEALGAPWSAWELVRRQVEVAGAGQAGLRFKLGGRLVHLPSGFPGSQGLRKWRDTVIVKSLEGQAALDQAGRLPLAFACQASFQAVRDGLPVAGEIVVSATLAEVGQVADVTLPEAEPLHLRQRTVLEERALLGGLPAAAVAPAKNTSP